MKIAVGIIGIFFSLVALLQSCTITGLSSLADNAQVGAAGSMGMLVSLLMFAGGAFAFGIPVVARVLFVLGFLLSLFAKKDFPDMMIWGWLSLALAVLLSFGAKAKGSEKSSGSRASGADQ